MRSILMILVLFAVSIFTTHAFASSGELVGSAHYLDDSQASQKVSPFLGLKVSEELMQNLSIVGLAGAGLIGQPEGSDLKGQYFRAQADLFYKMDAWKFGLGAGMESDKKEYKAWDDYAHVSASYQLW